MIRADIIAAVGREYLVSNIENDEFSYSDESPLQWSACPPSR